MKVIVKRALHFRHPGSDRTKDLVLRAHADPQAAPEWIQETAAFGHASKDGSVVEVVTKAAPREVPVSTETGLDGDDGKANGKGKDDGKANGKGKAAGN